MTGCLVNHYGNFITIPRTPLQRPQGSMLREPTFMSTEWLDQREVCWWDKHQNSREMWMGPMHGTIYHRLSTVCSSIYTDHICTIRIKPCHNSWYTHVILSLPPSLELQDHSSLLLNRV